MKIFGINDKLNFGKNSGKTILDIIKNDYLYIEWCFKNIENFVLTNNKDLLKNNEEVYKLNNEINNLKEKLNNELNEKNEIINSLEENIKFYNEKIPVFFDISKNRYYNIELKEIKNETIFITNFIELPKLIPDGENLPLPIIKIINNENTLEIDHKNLRISNMYFKKIELVPGYNDVDYYQRTIAILTNSENKKNVINDNGILYMNNWGKKLYQYSKRVGGSREDGDFDYWYESSDI